MFIILVPFVLLIHIMRKVIYLCAVSILSFFISFDSSAASIVIDCEKTNLQEWEEDCRRECADATNKRSAEEFDDCMKKCRAEFKKQCQDAKSNSESNFNIKKR